MPDYVGILKRSISALPEDDPALRQAVYERARSALARQLTGIDPPLSADEIEAQHQQLEDAIEEVESELAAEDEAPAEEAAAPTGPEPDELEEDRVEPSAEEEVVPHPAPMDESGPALRHASARPQPAVAQIEPAEEPEAGPVAAQPAAAERRSRAPLMVMLALVALMVAGAAALAYTQWPTVERVYADLRGQFFGETPTQEAAAPAEPQAEEPPAVAAVEPPAEPAAPAQPKADDRLPVDPRALEPAEESAPGEREMAARDPGEPATGTTSPPADLGVPDLPAFNRPAAPGDPGESPAAGLVAQRAIYYEQGEEGSSGRASQGAIAWERVERPQAPPAITARIDLPERGTTVTLTFTSNADPSLPASHLIEIELEGEESLGGPIQRVPALVLKPSEQARGQALAGAAVPVTDRLFWIALSDDPDQVGRNVSLLRDGSWFDMPIMFEDGQRALLTFEKGIPGDRVFETVLAEWSEARRTEQR
jgi:hypothetical protein